MSDDARKLILQRRARFVAAAVASVGIGAVSCEKEAPPPVVCLSQIQPPVDSGAIENSEADTGTTATDTGPRPMPCLSVSTAQPPANDPALPPDDNSVDSGTPPAPCLAPPMPCLKIAMPPKHH